MPTAATIIRPVACALLACLVWMLAWTAMRYIPNSPHARLMQSIRVLDSYRSNPESSGANEAFDDFLRIGRQAQLVDVTLLPVLAAVAVSVVFRFWHVLPPMEVAMVVLAFGAFLALPAGVRNVDAFDAVGIGTFSVALLLGRRWARRRMRMSAPQPT